MSDLLFAAVAGLGFYVVAMMVQRDSDAKPMPNLALQANMGFAPMSPPPGVYREFSARIDAFVRTLNRAAEGLSIGLNYWWRPVGAGTTADLSQHYAALAVDVQGIDQLVFAQRCQAYGLVAVFQSNDGVPYVHVHIQSRPAGLLATLGYTEPQLQQLARAA